MNTIRSLKDKQKEIDGKDKAITAISWNSETGQRVLTYRELTFWCYL